ncbi:hypothetical protein HOV56_gp01 [Nitrosopumilus spindle-shaped virus]|uniref:Uncharacterized protein n=1 Tax=Nitrosopumilus spindle-shaped virus TaxID=2508184 RepID=A0A514K2T5_9VIRU|nr:hypothetical protein HOV56_gp01 [Nitrosopumilus spindle-shaped virus]YP_010772831.1 hypothetical protein QIT54_gp01 [Nitrosopumilus spindle-shaped virus]QDI73890.1 hypothetical protein [Nitrosopumilus spindle-shaped virus]QDI73939.1 hypothetical protein [Nitrosopumilus spindle-shaped virus]
MHYLAALSIVFVALIVTTSSVTSVEAISNQGLSKSIGIALSKTCETMVKNNFTTTCPTYEDLVQLDSSNQYITGYFVYDDNGYYHRENPTLNNHYRFYDFENEWNIFVDPPGDMRNKMRMIYLESNFDIYKINGVSYAKGDDQIRSYGIDRYVHSCYYVTIGTDNWLELLPDSVRYVRSGCDDSQTKFKDTIEIKDEMVEHDITTSRAYQHNEWLNKIKENCLQEYGKCK